MNYPFRVICTYRGSSTVAKQQTYNAATLSDALDRSRLERRKPDCVQVEITASIDMWHRI